jgi:hypothetical protein
MGNCLQFDTKGLCRVQYSTWVRSDSGCSYVAVCNLMSFSFKDFVKVKCDVVINPLKTSGHYMYRQFNIQQSYVLLTQCIYVFCVDLKQTAIISLYSINWLVVITETECVYCEVRAQNLYIYISSLPPWPNSPQ